MMTAFLVAVMIAASPLKVAVSVRGDPALQTKPVEARLIARPADTHKPPGEEAEISFKLKVPGEVKVDLRPGPVWHLTVRAPGFWCDEKAVLIDKANEELSLELWPSGALTGKLRMLDRGRFPESLTVRSAPAPGVEQGKEVPKSQTICPVKDEKWSCEIPAGLVDVQLRARGYVSHYRWGVKVPRGEAVDLGRLDLRRGASVVGWVKTAEGPPPSPDSCRVRLFPRFAAAPSKEADRARRNVLSLSAPVNNRGFFHIEGVPPGDYMLMAKQEGFSLARRPVHVIENTQAELKEPLILDRPRTLEVLVSPPQDPWGKPWRVRLVETGETPNHAVEVAHSVVSQDGSWVRKGLRGGRYRLTVLGHAEQRWFTQELDIDSNNSPLYIEVPVVPVRGTVKLGKEPLRATLSFGGEYGALSVPLESDDSGEFVGFLPRAGDWEVTVVAEDPSVRRTFKKIEVKKPPREKDAKVEISLPNTLLVGEVVDEKGSPQDRATITIEKADASEPFIQSEVGKGGVFRIRGLPSGRMLLQAEAPQHLVSDLLEVILEESREQPPVRLVVRRKLQIGGQVLSSAGPVPGARIHAFPTENFSLLPASSQVTDAEGKFSVRLSPGTREMCLAVFPPGFSLRTFRLPVTPDRLLTIPVDQLGGTLVVDLAGFSSFIQEDGTAPFILHSGSYLAVSMLASLWGRPEGFGTGRFRVVVPNIEAGDYSVCLTSPAELPALLNGPLPPGRCAGGFLPQLGELSLKVPAAKK